MRAGTALPSDHYTGGRIEAARAFVTTLRTAMPDLHMTGELQIAEGDPVMTLLDRARHASRGAAGAAWDDQPGGDDGDQHARLSG